MFRKESSIAAAVLMTAVLVAWLLHASLAAPLSQEESKPNGQAVPATQQPQVLQVKDKLPEIDSPKVHTRSAHDATAKVAVEPELVQQASAAKPHVDGEEGWNALSLDRLFRLAQHGSLNSTTLTHNTLLNPGRIPTSQRDIAALAFVTEPLISRISRFYKDQQLDRHQRALVLIKAGKKKGTPIPTRTPESIQAVVDNAKAELAKLREAEAGGGRAFPVKQRILERKIKNPEMWVGERPGPAKGHIEVVTDGIRYDFATSDIDSDDTLSQVWDLLFDEFRDTILAWFMNSSFLSPEECATLSKHKRKDT